MQFWQMDAEASTNKHEQAYESSRDGELPSWRRTSAGAEAKRGGETTLLRPSPWPARGGNKTGPGAARLDARFGEAGWRAAGADKSPSALHEIWVGRPRVDTWTYDRRIGRRGGRGSLHKLPRGPLPEKLLKSCHVIPISWLIDFSFLFFMVHEGTIPKSYPVGPKGPECLNHFPYRVLWIKFFSIIY